MRKRKQSAPERSIARSGMSPSDPPSVGDKVEVYWNGDKRYYRGAISQVYSVWNVQVSYDDGDIEDLHLNRERWRYVRQSTGSSASAPLAPPAPPPPPLLPPAPQLRPSVPDPPPLPNGSGLKRVASTNPAANTEKRPRTLGDLAVLASEAASEVCGPILKELSDLRTKVTRNADGIEGAMIAIKNYFESRERATLLLTERVKRLENALRQREAVAQRGRFPSSSAAPPHSGSTNIVPQQPQPMQIVTPNLEQHPTESKPTPSSLQAPAPCPNSSSSPPPTSSAVTSITSSDPKSTTPSNIPSSKAPAAAPQRSSSAPMPLKLPVTHKAPKIMYTAKAAASAGVGSTGTKPVGTCVGQAASKTPIGSAPVFQLLVKAVPESDTGTSSGNVLPSGITQKSALSNKTPPKDKRMETDETAKKKVSEPESMEVDLLEASDEPPGDSAAVEKSAENDGTPTVERATSTDKDAVKEVGATTTKRTTPVKSVANRSDTNDNTDVTVSEKVSSVAKASAAAADAASNASPRKAANLSKDKEQPASTRRRNATRGREELVRQVDDVIGQLATKWLLEDITRPPPPPEEGNSRQLWAIDCSNKCYTHVSAELGKQKDIGQLVSLLNANLGQVPYDWQWLLDPTDDNVRNARCNYTAWEPVIRDGEWVAEQHVLREMARRFSHVRPQHVLPAETTAPDAMRLAVSVARHCAAPLGVSRQ